MLDPGRYGEPRPPAVAVSVDLDGNVREYEVYYLEDLPLELTPGPVLWTIDWSQAVMGPHPERIVYDEMAQAAPSWRDDRPEAAEEIQDAVPEEIPFGVGDAVRYKANPAGRTWTVVEFNSTFAMRVMELPVRTCTIARGSLQKTGVRVELLEKA